MFRSDRLSVTRAGSPGDGSNIQWHGLVPNGHRHQSGLSRIHSDACGTLSARQQAKATRLWCRRRGPVLLLRHLCKTAIFAHAGVIEPGIEVAFSAKSVTEKAVNQAA